MFPFKFLTTNRNKQTLLDLVFEDYIEDLNDIVLEHIEYQGMTATTRNGTYYITNMDFNSNGVYSRAICYPNEFPEHIIRMSTYPDEVSITIGQRTNNSQHP